MKHMEMNSIAKLIKGLVVACIFVFAGSIMAATDGTLGPTSTGTVDISVGVGDQVQITGLSDIAGPYVGGAGFSGNTTACVYRNGGSGNFNVTATSLNGSGIDHRIVSGATFIVYDVTFNDSLSGAVNLDNGVIDTGFTNANNVSPTCGGAPQSTIDVNIPDVNFAGAPAGTYTDTLTILVGPQ